jgi:2'-hydroxyisoflavone reductase
VKILILGGSKFLGRHIVEAALARKHEITMFNRGHTSPELFPTIKKLRGDRDGNLEALRGGRWDCVIDTSGQTSAQVKASAELLAPSIEHYIFVSSLSVYADFSTIGMTEKAPTASLPPGTIENQDNAETYGPRKFLCEQAAETMMPGKALILRPGLIIGPYDSTDRFIYWLRRVASGSEVIAPENPNSPIQLIDARDLAEWIIRMAEIKQTGVFNVTGPKEPLTFGQMLNVCKNVTGSRAHFTWVDGEFLLHAGVTPWGHLPFWIPASDTSYAGHFLIDSSKAFGTGLVCKPIEETIRDIFLWDCEREKTESKNSPIGLTTERERTLIDLWKNRQVPT